MKKAYVSPEMFSGKDKIEGALPAILAAAPAVAAAVSVARFVVREVRSRSKVDGMIALPTLEPVEG
ncbi:hypothetical protein FACS1894200_14290 [Spirochaetia bacterium]|nr:hypothetical protein FACS1894200_14290 [Spirochaetia bacterium]